jgi:peptide/nickel transport system ATP-binding protein
MILNPDVMIFDEALSGLDATTSAGILELLLRYQASGSKSYAFITHDLQIARDLSGSVVAMQDGKITESTIFSNPSFPGAGIGQSMSSSHA